MDFEVRKGFLIYKDKEKNHVIACPHSGPALDHPTTRDDNSETVGSLCWRELKGTLIISSMPRKRIFGVDFNRDIPPLKLALDSYKIFLENKLNEFTFEYMQKYAWVCKDENDYEQRLKIYQNFWGEIEKYDKIILIHRSFNRMKSYPSIMDFITFKSKGIKKSKIINVVKDINKKYASFFSRIEQGYKKMILFESQRFVADIIENEGEFKLSKFKPHIKSSILKDITGINRYASKYIIKRLNENFTINNYLEAIKNALDNAPPPRVTVEHVFDGSLALGPKRKLFPKKGKTIIEVESSYFMNLWYPKTAALIIKDIYYKLGK
ncbi:MAG: hypothetical protein KJ674_04445 [Nanoarchaeota archaeon]|nr:hypothetical protein [Nanoarchaeota archaeon]